MSQAVDQALEKHRGLVESRAAALAATPGAKRVGAEYDDLVQEGMIAVWQSTERGHDPTLVVVNRMRDWVRYLGKRDGEGYQAHMPLDDFRDLARAD